MSRRIFCKVLLVIIAIFGLLVLSNILPAQGRSGEALERVKEIQERHTDRLMAMDGVEGMAIGFNQNDRLAIKVFTAGPGVRGIPQELEGVPVQVVVTGKIYALVDPTARFPRPVPTGVSTGHPDITAGTIGCRVTDGINVYALSNNHVYANENKASIGDNVLQPGTFDGGIDPDDAIGTLADFEPIMFGRRARNEIDAAIALTNTDMVGTATPDGGYGTPSSTIVTAVLGQQVQKFGRTTELTTGEVTGVNATVNVGYGPGKTAKFVKQIIIEPGGFSAGGDSGSLIVTDDGNRNPVGLLFAGSSTITVANRIDLVLDRFNVTVDGEEGLPPATGLISGTVTASDGTGAIVGATVSVDTGQSATTAGNGTYTITDVPTGNRSVTASADGFESQTKPAPVTEGGTTTVDFALTPTPVVGALYVDVKTDSDIYTLGDRVSITVTVTENDATGAAVEGAAVHVEIATASGRRYAGDGATDTSGEAKFSFKTKRPDGTGTYTVTADASKSGYDPGSGSTTFEVESR